MFDDPYFQKLVLLYPYIKHNAILQYKVIANLKSAKHQVWISKNIRQKSSRKLAEENLPLRNSTFIVNITKFW